MIDLMINISNFGLSRRPYFLKNDDLLNCTVFEFLLEYAS